MRNDWSREGRREENRAERKKESGGEGCEVIEGERIEV